MDAQHLIALLVFLLPLAYSPGPGNAFFALSGARHGLMQTTPALLGYHVATFIVTLALGCGLSLSLLTSPIVGMALSVCSALYMLWLAFVCFQASAKPQTAEIHQEEPTKAPSFWAGAMVLLLNPKAYAIIILMFSSFLKASDGVFVVLWITSIFTLNNYLAFVAWVFAGQLLSRWLSGRMANIVYGISFLGVALWILAGLR